MKLVFDQMIAESADGRTKSVNGGRDLQQARKLEKQGLARVEHLYRTFCGYGKSYNIGYVCNTYEVTFI